MNMQNLAALAAIASNGNSAGIPSLTSSGKSLPVYYLRFLLPVQLVRMCKFADNYMQMMGMLICKSLYMSNLNRIELN